MKYNEYCFNKYEMRALFNSEIESLIKEFSLKNNLILPDAFCRSHYRFFLRQNPFYVFEYSILFLARPRNADDELREQIEFQIQLLK